MNRLTREERRRVYLAHRRACDTMVARLQAGTVEAPPPDGRGLMWIAWAAMIAVLLGGGLLAAQTLELHSLDALVGALLPTV
jgi:hypothetical protein